MSGVLAPVSYEPIKAVRVLSSQAVTPQTIRELEAATQTFKLGVPLMLSAGNVTESTFTAASIIYGVSAEPAHNLATAGTAQDENEGSPPNMPLAVTTAIGAWIRDGRCSTYGANGQTVFSIALKLGQVYTSALLGGTYGITKDVTSGFWYIDSTVTTGNSAVAVIIGNDSSAPNTATGGARVFFTFAQSKRFFQ
jgi:hypothetical protein